MTAMSAMPAHSDPLAGFPAHNARAYRINDASHLVSRDPWILNARPEAFFCEHIAVADSASLDLDPNLSLSGGRDFTFNQFKGPLRTCDLHRTHL
jgi:hypothetical protein